MLLFISFLTYDISLFNMRLIADFFFSQMPRDMFRKLQVTYQPFLCSQLQ